MHSFNYKPLVRAVCFCLLVALLLSLCSYVMYDDRTYTRLMMHELYTDEAPIDLVFIGGSVTYKGFDPKIWDEALGMHTFNLGSSSQTLDDTYFLMKEVFRHQSPKYCIYSTTHISFMDLEDYENPQRHYILFDYFKPSLNKLDFWMNAFDEDTALTALFPFMRDKTLSLGRILGFLDILKIKSSENYRSYGYEVYDRTQEYYQGRGFVYREEAKADGNVGRLNPVWYSEAGVKPESVEYFLKLAELCRENDCELIMIPTPVPYGSMALQQDYQQIVDFYQSLARESGAAIFDFSLSKPELFDPEDSYFYDHVHLNGTGSAVFSRAAANLIKDHISGQQVSGLFYDSYQEFLNANPCIFNAWLETTSDGYYAGCTQGADVTPEYRFSVRETAGDPWECIQDYSTSSFLSLEQIPEDSAQIQVEVRPQGSTEEYQQFDILTR